MRYRRDLNALQTKAYFLGETTNPRFVKARHSDNFVELAMTALEEIVPRGHHAKTPIDTIYVDLLDAHFIAERARPITMEGMTFGEWYGGHDIWGVGPLV
jgi:hypothetical protein